MVLFVSIDFSRHFF